MRWRRTWWPSGQRTRTGLLPRGVRATVDRAGEAGRVVRPTQLRSLRRPPTRSAAPDRRCPQAWARCATCAAMPPRGCRHKSACPPAPTAPTLAAPRPNSGSQPKNVAPQQVSTLCSDPVADVGARSWNTTRSDMREVDRRLVTALAPAHGSRGVARSSQRRPSNRFADHDPADARSAHRVQTPGIWRDHRRL